MTIIFGPTSSGKTSLAIKLCKELNGEIISADSRQVYKHMDIGTGKLPLDQTATNINRTDNYWEIDGVKIHGYDLVTPNRYFSAYDFAKFALQKTREIRKTGKTPFLVGGTGFYIDVVTGRMQLSGAKPERKLRESLNKTPTKNLLNRLRQENSNAASQIDPANRHRIIRALEIEFSKEKQEDPLNYLKDEEFQYIGLNGRRDYLYKRTDKWLNKAWENGLLEETDDLMKKYPRSEKLNGLVYKSAVSYILGKTSMTEARQRSQFDLHAYIRRQLTWFNKYKEAEWVDIKDSNLYRSVLNLVKSWQ